MTRLENEIGLTVKGKSITRVARLQVLQLSKKALYPYSTLLLY